MLPHHPFDYHSINDLRDDILHTRTELPMTDDLSLLSTPLQAGSLRLPNRMVVLPPQRL